MDLIKSKLKSLGAIMVLFGVASGILSFFDYNLTLLLWVDIWGSTIGWVIRIGLIVAGGALLFLFNDAGEGEEAEAGNS